MLASKLVQLRLTILKGRGPSPSVDQAQPRSFPGQTHGQRSVGTGAGPLGSSGQPAHRHRCGEGELRSTAEPSWRCTPSVPSVAPDQSTWARGSGRRPLLAAGKRKSSPFLHLPPSSCATLAALSSAPVARRATAARATAPVRAGTIEGRARHEKTSSSSSLPPSSWPAPAAPSSAPVARGEAAGATTAPVRVGPVRRGRMSSGKRQRRRRTKKAETRRMYMASAPSPRSCCWSPARAAGGASSVRGREVDVDAKTTSSSDACCGGAPVLCAPALLGSCPACGAGATWR